MPRGNWRQDTIGPRRKLRSFWAWNQMVQRCTNQRNPRWPYYGGRGIAVCERWLNFPLFFADMGECPPGLTLERKNNEGDYEANNCVWATRKTQMNNTRRSRRTPKPAAMMTKLEALARGAQVSAARRNAASKAACEPIKERWKLPSDLYATEALIAETGLSRNTVTKILGKRPAAQKRHERNVKRAAQKAALEVQI